MLLFAFIPLFLLVNGSLASTAYWARANAGFMPTDAWRAATDQSGNHVFIGRVNHNGCYDHESQPTFLHLSLFSRRPIVPLSTQLWSLRGWNSFQCRMVFQLQRKCSDSSNSSWRSWESLRWESIGRQNMGDWNCRTTVQRIIPSCCAEWPVGRKITSELSSSPLPFLKTSIVRMSLNFSRYVVDIQQIS